MRSTQPLCLAAVAALVSFALAGAAFAKTNMRPAEAPSVHALRSIADHYRTITWNYERAARVGKTPSSLSYRKSSDRAYLQWTIDTWTRRAYTARRRALTAIEHKLAIELPAGPSLHAQLSRRVAYSKQLTLRLRRIYPGNVTRSFASARAGSGRAQLQLWQARSAASALAVALHAKRQPVIPELPDFLAGAFACIHRYEGAWTSNTGNGYYGGLQMDLAFQSRYGGSYLSRWGTADNWPSWAQLDTAARAYRAGRGFSPWPNTARFCGLI